MKNMNKRTKVILAIVGIVVIAAIAIGVNLVGQPSTESLSGSTVLIITPSDPAIPNGNIVALEVNAKYDCAWSSSDTNIVSLVNYVNQTKTVVVQGNALGTATITAKCGAGVFNVNKVTTSVTVAGPLVISPELPKLNTCREIKLSVPAPYSCNWKSSDSVVSFYGATTGGSVTVQSGLNVGQAVITAECGSAGTTATTVQVAAPVQGLEAPPEDEGNPPVNPPAGCP